MYKRIQEGSPEILALVFGISVAILKRATIMDENSLDILNDFKKETGKELPEGYEEE